MARRVNHHLSDDSDGPEDPRPYLRALSTRLKAGLVVKNNIPLLVGTSNSVRFLVSYNGANKTYRLHVATAAPGGGKHPYFDFTSEKDLRHAVKKLGTAEAPAVPATVVP